MITIQGICNTAVCYCSELHDNAAEQIKAVCSQTAFEGLAIRIMPDVHAGMGCTIGTTMTIADKIVPGMVGVDIGCGMETVKIAESSIDFPQIDKLIREKIPAGREIRAIPHPLNGLIDLSILRCSRHVNLERAHRSIGTLGGGNHFIEIDSGEDGALYIVVHSGSRHIGNEVAKYYQDVGFRALCGNARHQLEEAIERMKAEGKAKEIHKTINELKKRCAALTSIPKDLAYVEGTLFDDYIFDMKIIQQFAALNRKAMVDVILSGMNLTPIEGFTIIHNYIDTDAMILRKGAVSAKLGEKLLIPINMRDGNLVCIGKGNADWNYSAPHGTGRLLSRTAAFDRLSMEQYREEMSGIYSTSITPDTLDESPMAYKSMDEIVGQVAPTVDIVNRIKPLYNFKSAD